MFKIDSHLCETVLTTHKLKSLIEEPIWMVTVMKLTEDTK